MAKKVGKAIFSKDNLIDDKKKALETALSQIERQFGKGAVMKLGDQAALDVDAISTGSLGMDLALGVGGVPRGRIVEIFGPESSGKTTVALCIAAQAQKANGEVAFIDVEHALDPSYAKQLGVDIDSLMVSQPNSGEQALEIAELLIRSGAVDVLVVDSVAAMTTKAEIEGAMGDTHVGLQARLMSQALRKLTGIISKTNCVAIFINQIREKIGNTYGGYSGPSETTPGGRALKFYSSVRMDIRKGESLRNDNGVYGSKTKCKIIKNKVAPPFKTAEFDLIYGKGISYYGEVVDLGNELDIIQRAGAWYSYKGERMGQGRENTKTYLEEHPDLLEEIVAKIKEEYAGGLPEGKDKEKDKNQEKEQDSQKGKEKTEEKGKEEKERKATSFAPSSSAEKKTQPDASAQAKAKEPDLNVKPDQGDFTS